MEKSEFLRGLMNAKEAYHRDRMTGVRAASAAACAKQFGILPKRAHERSPIPAAIRKLQAPRNCGKLTIDEYLMIETCWEEFLAQTIFWRRVARWLRMLFYRTPASVTVNIQS
ncbi:MAG: hypothetical protein UY47_C0007G0028 [Parcubacteria group bacterium GW2011_GWB1_49_7]|uniref:Uncharacterized protein n=1 Tax=Candidatus Zambryskibacteria bacterium RIFCSPHIGHO2_01_FULL_46_25 TaxID=1802738 RepID=A0A1G2SYM2_9BACT|nr:MAG: hypothetical protein UX71_C0002G0144 [Parcubacteria group bacterium GW2011_GWA1_47_10]KKW09687.1 MAG: hypothetical protein UY47_C0007G0028 [Parcubacteria group bacterium GW2011_GWB1_49_7]OHA90136.1 MAG: hypothetical protein A2838_00700 [Candidatus Zambryskibacteria bacterium RIFCSPHIGHO2_01_FULL_46_25]OHB01314.1 MAG: hypothetical protein A3F53_02400 [Candidatus Zambryskibacteria bacterium RIFCSPHIGHO2_12_FULL_48_10]OHB06490.1 MAG: hypothetical protein A3A31_02555 [Candidatus Zambryskiba